MPNLGTTVNQGHRAFDNLASILGVIGTLGTADVSGTALTLPVAIDPATGAMFVQDLASSGGTQPVSGTVVVSNIVGGTITSGSIINAGGTVANLATGTLNALASGTITAGTFTLNSKPGSQILSYGTFGNGTIGTLVAAPGVGTSIYLCSYDLDGDVTALGTPDVVLSFGTVQSGAGVIVRAGLPTTTPLSQSFNFPVSANLTNTPLTFMQLSGGGTMSWNITYFVQ